MGRRLRIALYTALALALAGCSTTNSRIRKHQEAFEAYPESVQQNLRRGAIDVGYTPEMVFIALGEPDRKVDRVSEDGMAQVWTWWKSTPGVGISLGGWNSLGSNVGLGTGVSVGEPGRREQTAVVEFRSGRVRRFEAVAR